MQQSDSIAALAAALAKAQGAIKGAAKDSVNPGFRSKYADLASVWDACRKQLSDNGLAVIQTTDEAEDAVVVVTTLAHSSGEWISGRLKLRPVKADPQGMGSAITYARRYALSAIVGIAPDDDDGQAAQGLGQHQQRQANGSDSGPSRAQIAALAAKNHGVKPEGIPADLAQVGVLPSALPSNQWTPEQVQKAFAYYSHPLQEVQRG